MGEYRMEPRINADKTESEMNPEERKAYIMVVRR